MKTELEDMKIKISHNTVAIDESNYIPPISVIAQLSADLRDATRSLAARDARLVRVENLIIKHGECWKAVGMSIDEMLKTDLTDDAQILEYVWEEVKKIREAAHHNYHEGVC